MLDQNKIANLFSARDGLDKCINDLQATVKAVINQDPKVTKKCTNNKRALYQSTYYFSERARNFYWKFVFDDALFSKLDSPIMDSMFVTSEMSLLYQMQDDFNQVLNSASGETICLLILKLKE